MATFFTNEERKGIPELIGVLLDGVRQKFRYFMMKEVLESIVSMKVFAEIMIVDEIHARW